MLIECHGSRGSIPVSGREYLRFGGDTACIEITTADGATVLVDAGSGIRRPGNRLAVTGGGGEIHLLFTHSHWDHMLGFPFFKPIYRSNFHIHIHGCAFAQRTIESMVADTMAPPHFPVNFKDVRARFTYHGVCDHRFRIGHLRITPILISHPNLGLGYRFDEGRHAFVFLTDNELGFVHPGGCPEDAYRDFAANADLLIHDAEFTDREYLRTRTWGHSTWRQAARLAMAANVKALGLYHHNQDRTDRGVFAMEQSCRRFLAREGCRAACFAVRTGTRVEF